MSTTIPAAFAAIAARNTSRGWTSTPVRVPIAMTCGGSISVLRTVRKSATKVSCSESRMTGRARAAAADASPTTVASGRGSSARSRRPALPSYDASASRERSRRYPDGEALDAVEAILGGRIVTVATMDGTEQAPLEGAALLEVGVTTEVKIDLRTAQERKPDDPVLDRQGDPKFEPIAEQVRIAV